MAKLHEVLAVEGELEGVNKSTIDEGKHTFKNKADHFIIVHRPEELRDETLLRVAKVKFRGTGVKTNIMLSFDTASGRFDTLDKKDQPVTPEERLPLSALAVV